MYRVAVMGDRDSIYGFAALGLETFPYYGDEQSAVKQLRRLCDGDYAIIYITEALAEILEDEIEKVRETPLPAIILIPGVSGNTGKGMLSVRVSVEQAVGSDIIFNGE